MFLLQSYPTTTNYIQTLCAIATTFLAIAAIVQGNKIKELADIVKELKQSNSILEQRFNLEKLANIRQSMPVFQIADFREYDETSRIEIILENVGIKFNHINTDNQTDNIDHFYNYETEGNSQVPPRIVAFFKPGEIRDNFEFDIRTKSSTGHEHIQRLVKKFGARVDLRPPQL
jgi:hypothetical protein